MWTKIITVIKRLTQRRTKIAGGGKTLVRAGKNWDWAARRHNYTTWRAKKVDPEKSHALYWFGRARKFVIGISTAQDLVKI